MKSLRIAVLCALLVSAAAIGSACKTITVVDSGKGKTYTLSPKFDTTGGYHSVIIAQDIEQVYKATMKGLDDLKIDMAEKRCDKLTGQVSGSLADGKKYRIQLDKLTEGTSMKLYFGDFGSNKRVEQIFAAISDRL